MATSEGTLLVLRVTGGWPRSQVLRACKVVVDGREAGAVGEDIYVAPGTHSVTVRTAFWTCNSLPVELGAGGKLVLNYAATPLGWLALFAGFPMFCLLSPLLVLGLQWLQGLVAQVEPINGLIILCGFLAGAGWLAFGGVPWLLARAGLYSYRLSPAAP